MITLMVIILMKEQGSALNRYSGDRYSGGKSRLRPYIVTLIIVSKKFSNPAQIYSYD